MLLNKIIDHGTLETKVQHDEILQQFCFQIDMVSKWHLALL